MKLSIKLFLFLLITFVAVGCDRVTKNLAQEHLANREPISYFNDFVRLEYAENSGAAMSLGSDWPESVRFWALHIFPFALLLCLLAYTAKEAGQLHKGQIASLALIFAGGAGNMIDRFFNQSRVPDFIIMGFPSLRTGIFNVADMCITAGVLAILGFSFWGKR